MMSHKDPSRLADRIIFWFAAAMSFMFYSQAVYDYGYGHGRATCLPKVEIPKIRWYDLSPRQLKRMIKYEVAKAEGVVK